jgi:hypothetical protein
MRETTRARIETDLSELAVQIGVIKAEGDYLLQSWVGGSKPSGKRKSYPRVQSRLPQFGGKKVRHICQGESVAEWEAKCDRGQRIGKLIKQREQMMARLD